MNFNIDDYKVNGKKVFISGWAHFDKYKVEITSGNDTKTVKNYQSRYDINMLFNEKIDENEYGFKEEIEFEKNIKLATVKIVTNDEEYIALNIDNRKVISGLRKVKKALGKVKRGIKFLWREYHFLVPPTMLKKHINDVLHKQKDNQLYNPSIDSEYNDWLQKHKLPIKVDAQNTKIKIISNSYKKADILIKKNDDFSKILNKIQDEYVCLVNGNVELCEGFNSYINEQLVNDYDLIYFDNDQTDDDGKYTSPMFKPDWSRDTLLGVNYIGNCIIIKTKILKKIKQQQWNLYEILLNLIDKDLKIKHIPCIMYHDKTTIRNEKKTLEEYIKNNKIDACVKKNTDGITNTVIYNLKDKPLISIIIPTKDHADILEQCLSSIYKKSTYKNYEIIVIDNNSEEQETFDLLKEYDKKKNFKYKRIECEFNYSYLNNEAAKLAKGKYIVLLNNDIEVISPNWLEIMVGYASRKHIGTVGVKLLFPDNTIQHAGIIMGKGGLAGHAHYGKNKDYISPQYELKIPYDVSACTAACLMVEKKKFKEVDGLEEKLKVAFNDVDFNLKLLDKGYNNVFLPNVELYHYESKSRGLDTTPEKQKRFIQEWSLINDKWKKYIDEDPYYNNNFSKNDDYMLK